MLHQRNIAFNEEHDGTFCTVSFHLESADAAPFAEIKFKVVDDGYGGFAVEYEQLTVFSKPFPEWELEQARFDWESFSDHRGNPCLHEDARDAVLSRVLGYACRPLLRMCVPPKGTIVLVAKTEGETATQRQTEFGPRQVAA